MCQRLDTHAVIADSPSIPVLNSFTALSSLLIVLLTSAAVSRELPAENESDAERWDPARYRALAT